MGNSLKAIWKKSLIALKEKIPKSEFLTWFYPTILASLDEENLTARVEVSGVFFADTIKSKYLDMVAASIEEATALAGLKVEVAVNSEVSKNHKQVINVSTLLKALDKAEKGTNEVNLAEGIESKVINSKYLLSNYVVGAENELAYAASLAVARKPGKRYNPLFIYGGVGLGKTHLLQGIGNEVLKNFPKTKVCYVTSEQITNDIIQAIRTYKTDKLREKYRQVDLLIVDDIQFLAHKEMTQVEFFNTFNDLYENNKQIILSSDRPPQELDQIEPRLRSRFEWGMIVDVQFPDFETRFAILQQKAKEKEVLIHNDVLEFIAHNVHHSIRELEGVLNQAIALYELKQISPSVESVAKLMKKTHKRQTLVGAKSLSNEISTYQEKDPDEVISAVCDFFNISERQVRGDSRKRNIMLTRQIIMYLLKEVYELTYEDIGEIFGGKEHSTVIHSCKKVSKLISENPKVRREVNTLKAQV